MIRGHNVMKSYWNRPDATAEVMKEGWLLTGDLARVDDDGYFFIVDRKKDMIIRGGFNVYPREIEEVLYEHPAVLEAAVIAVPDEAMGEEVGAAVVLRPGAHADADDIARFVKDRVAAYKYPRRVWFTTSCPRAQRARCSNATSPCPSWPSGRHRRAEVNMRVPHATGSHPEHWMALEGGGRRCT